MNTINTHRHIKTVCSCGEVMSQCRCPAEKIIFVENNACEECKRKLTVSELLTISNSLSKL